MKSLFQIQIKMVIPSTNIDIGKGHIQTPPSIWKGNLDQSKRMKTAGNGKYKIFLNFYGFIKKQMTKVKNSL